MVAPGALAAGPRASAVLAPLDALVDECLRTGVSRVHLEACGTGLRVRLRDGERLATRRADGVAAAEAVASLEAALDALAEAAGAPPGATEPVRFVTEGSAGRAFVSVARARGAHAASAVLTLSDYPPAAPTIDALVDDARALGALRGALGARDGLVLLVGADPVTLGALGEAIAQECVGPDRKVVHACAAARYPLAGVLQLDASDLDVDGVLRQDPDAVVLDPHAPGIGSTAALRAACSNALVVRAATARDVEAALVGLRAEGAADAWLARRLLAAVRVHRVRLLCDACRHPASEASPVSYGDSPARHLLARSLGRACEAPGCAACGNTGVGRTRALVDVLEPTPSTRGLLDAGELAAAALELESRARARARLRADVGRGLVGAAEAARHGAHGDDPDDRI